MKTHVLYIYDTISVSSSYIKITLDRFVEKIKTRVLTSVFCPKVVLCMR